MPLASSIAATVGDRSDRLDPARGCRDSASQVLEHLTSHHAVRATEHGCVGRPARLLDLDRQRARPLLVQPESYWYRTRGPAEQARRIVDLANDQRRPIAFSADLAPDLLVPCRHPTLTVVSTADSLVLDAAGLVPAEGRADASVVVRWTSDATLLSPAPGSPREVEGVPITDPVQQWWDLLDLGGEDRAEAAERLAPSSTTPSRGHGDGARVVLRSLSAAMDGAFTAIGT